MVLQEMERQYANIHLVSLVEKHGTKQVSHCLDFVCVHVCLCLCVCLYLCKSVCACVHAYVCVSELKS